MPWLERRAHSLASAAAPFLLVPSMFTLAKLGRDANHAGTGPAANCELLCKSRCAKPSANSMSMSPFLAESAAEKVSSSRSLESHGHNGPAVSPGLVFKFRTCRCGNAAARSGKSPTNLAVSKLRTVMLASKSAGRSFAVQEMMVGVVVVVVVSVVVVVVIVVSA